MAAPIKRFLVEGLHGDRTVELNFESNKLILVGENGTGKSTVANLLFYFLTRQFDRMREYEFKSATVNLGGQDLRVVRENLGGYKEGWKTHGHFPSRLLKEIQRIGPRRFLESPALMRKFGKNHDISFGALKRLLDELENDTAEDLRDVESALDRDFGTQVLFLPTYRRIELDIQQIFRTMHPRHRDELADRIHDRNYGTGHIELIEFGMRDVREIVQRKMEELKSGLTTALTNLMGVYLKEVIAGAHQSVTAEGIVELDDIEIDAIFSRLDESIVGAKEQAHLRTTIKSIKENQSLSDQDTVVAHFLTRLIKLHRDRQEAERPVKAYVELCNQYLRGKVLRYDNIDSRLDLVQTGQLDGKKLRFASLSSGEKQIVSLFTHICLSLDKCFLIIDEPELSLSVPWQQKLLPDICSTGHCEGFLTVTHSPFIFENDLEQYTQPIESFTRLYRAEPEDEL